MDTVQKILALLSWFLGELRDNVNVEALKATVEQAEAAGKSLPDVLFAVIEGAAVIFPNVAYVPAIITVLEMAISLFTHHTVQAVQALRVDAA